MALLFRLLTEEDETRVISSLDGIGAYDHGYRNAFFAELRADPELSAMLPFVRLWYGRQSHYTWTDDSGTDHRIPKREGIEQGDPLAPLLFSLAIRRALSNAQTFLRPGECIFAFLDDVYTITTRGRAADITAHVDGR